MSLLTSYPGRKLAGDKCFDAIFVGFGLKFLGGGPLSGGGGSPAFRFLPRLTSLFFGSDFLERFGLIFGILGVYEMKQNNTKSKNRNITNIDASTQQNSCSHLNKCIICVRNFKTLIKTFQNGQKKICNICSEH